MHKKWTTEEFIEKAKLKHGNKYNYSLVEYIDNKTRIKIICSKHGEFEQIPSNHIKAITPCKKCASTKMSLGSKRFIKKSNEIHNNKYDYSLVEYKNTVTKVKIICPDHGVFEQLPVVHLQGYGCQRCSGCHKYSTEEFIKKANNIYDNKYDYTKFTYVSSEYKSIIICTKHGEFMKAPHAHLSGQGCPACRESKGEENIREYLNKNNINFESQFTFKDCRNINPLPFDFYIPSLNLAIEYDGIQHFEPREFFGGIESFNKLKIRDSIKDKFCNNNNIKLVRIKYNENINKSLKEVI